MAALQAQVDELRADRDRARASLAQLAEQVGAALQLVTAGLPATSQSAAF